MKIEMISENQIRCTLTKEDLAARHIKLSELAYGTSKARLLFREMIEKASADYGFTTEDIPLMVEAIPISSEGIVLIISKVNEPEELDTRFSEFTAYDEDSLDESMLSEMDEIHSHDDGSLLDFFKRLYERVEQGKNTSSVSSSISISEDAVVVTFSDMASIIRLAKDFSNYYELESTLYKSPKGVLTLLLKLESPSQENFKSLCLLAAEYGRVGFCLEGSESHMREHFNTIINGDALQTLAKM